MEHFVAIAGWIISAILFLGGIFFSGCSRCEKKDKDSTWKISCSLSVFLFLVAAYCAVSAYMVG